MSDITAVRRAMIVAVVGSLTVAALIGIAVLLGGEFGETERDILATTLVVGGFATTSLCHLAVVTRAVRVVGVVGLVAGLGAAFCALVLIWNGDETLAAEAWLKGLAVLAVVAISLAQTSLLLLAAQRPSQAVRTSLAVTLVAVAVVATMVVVPVLTDLGLGDLYVRLFGVAAIVDALGTVALPVLGLVMRRSAPAVVRLHLDLPAELAARLDARVGAGSRESAALEALERAL